MQWFCSWKFSDRKSFEISSLNIFKRLQTMQLIKFSKNFQTFCFLNYYQSVRSLPSVYNTMFSEIYNNMLLSIERKFQNKRLKLDK